MKNEKRPLRWHCWNKGTRQSGGVWETPPRRCELGGYVIQICLHLAERPSGDRPRRSCHFDIHWTKLGSAPTKNNECWLFFSKMKAKVKAKVKEKPTCWEKLWAKTSLFWVKTPMDLAVTISKSTARLLTPALIQAGLSEDHSHVQKESFLNDHFKGSNYINNWNNKLGDE